MRVLIYSDDPGIGGVAQFDHMFSLGLRRRGHEAILVATRQDSPRAREREAAGVVHAWLDYDTVTEFARTLNDVAAPTALLAALRPDAILFSDSCPVSNFAAKKAARLSGVPYAARVGFAAPYLAERFAPVLDELAAHYRAAAAVAAVSQENLDLMIRLFRLPPDKARLIYSGKGDAFFAPADPEIRRERRRSLGLGDDDVLCFTAARLEPVKGYQYQMAAIERLRTLPVWRKLAFAWAGPGSMEADLSRAATERGIADKVRLLGQCWDVAEWLSAADLFVLPAQAEGLPQAVIEAMARRLPIISTRVSGIPEALGDAGVLLPDPLVDPGGVIDGLTRHIALLADDPARRRALADAAFARADRMFRLERMVGDYEALMVAAAAGATPPGGPGAGRAEDPAAVLRRRPLLAPGSPFVSRLPEAADPADLAAWTAARSRLSDETAGGGDGWATAGFSGDAAVVYTLVRSLKPRLVYEIGCGDGEAARAVLVGLARNGDGRLESFAPAVGPDGPPTETRLRSGWPADADLSRRHLNQGDPRRTLPTRPADERPDLLIVGPDVDEVLFEWLAKAVAPGLTCPSAFLGVLTAGPQPKNSGGAIYLLNWMQHAGCAPLAACLLGEPGASAVLAGPPTAPADAGDDRRAMLRLLDGPDDAAATRFPLTAERLRPGTLSGRRWAAPPAEDRYAAAAFAGAFERERLGIAEILMIANRARSGALPQGFLAGVAARPERFDRFALGVLTAAAATAGDRAAATALAAEAERRGS